MQKIFKNLKIILIPLILLLIVSFVLALIIGRSGKDLKIAMLLCGFICFLIYGLFIGLKFKKKGFMFGLLGGLIIVIIILLFQILTDKNIELLSYVKYLIYILGSSIGGILGVNVKKD